MKKIGKIGLPIFIIFLGLIFYLTPLKNPVLAADVDLPCQNHQDDCTFDSRTFYKGDDGKFTESVTAYGKFWNWTIDPEHQQWIQGPNAPWSSGQLNDAEIQRYQDGPCKNQETCTFDTRTFYKGDDGKWTESVTAADGKFWNWTIGSNTPWSTGNLYGDVSRYRDGPCKNYPTDCKFDTRTIFIDNDGKQTESIIAYGQFWNWWLEKDGIVPWSNYHYGKLKDIPRYKDGPCKDYLEKNPDKPDGCKFDSRHVQYFPAGKYLLEQITAYGRMWGWKILDKVPESTRYQALPENGTLLSSVSRYYSSQPSPSASSSASPSTSPSVSPETEYTQFYKIAENLADLDSATPSAFTQAPFDYTFTDPTPRSTAICIRFISNLPNRTYDVCVPVTLVAPVPTPTPLPIDVLPVNISINADNYCNLNRQTGDGITFTATNNGPDLSYLQIQLSNSADFASPSPLPYGEITNLQAGHSSSLMGNQVWKQQPNYLPGVTYYTKAFNGNSHKPLSAFGPIASFTLDTCGPEGFPPYCSWSQTHCVSDYDCPDYPNFCSSQELCIACPEQ